MGCTTSARVAGFRRRTGCKHFVTVADIVVNRDASFRQATAGLCQLAASENGSLYIIDENIEIDKVSELDKLARTAEAQFGDSSSLRSEKLSQHGR